jgi:YVTN family beta-propeller protein
MILRAAAWLALLFALVPPSADETLRAVEPSWSQSTIELWEERGLVFVIERDASLVVAVDACSGAPVWTRTVGRSPQRLQMVTRRGRAELFVSADDGEVWLLDPLDGTVRDRIDVGPTARGFDVVADRYLVTALYALHQLSIWDLQERRAVSRLPVRGFPTAVRAASPDEVWVAHFYDGRMERINILTGATTRSLDAEPAVNQVVGFLPDAGRRLLYVPYSASNAEEDDPSAARAVLPMVRIVGPEAAGTTDRRLPLALMDRPVSGPEAVALIRNEGALISVNSRSNDLSIIDLRRFLTIAHVEVGKYPQGIAVDRAGARAFVANAHDHSVSVVDLSTFSERARWTVGQETLPPEVARGRDLFCDADSPAMALNSWISCSNCHPEGHSDGRSWKLPGKPRLRTKDLHGLASTLPAGWQATQDEMEDEEHFIRTFFRGHGLSPVPPHPPLGRSNRGLSADLDALSAYVYSLRFAPSPHLRNGSPSDAARRGKRLFGQLGCASCHPAPTYTVSSVGRNHLASGVVTPDPQPVGPIDVPSLNGVYAQPHLLHDGRAANVEDVFRRWNAAGRHGRTANLDAGALDDLSAFLLALPEVPAGPAATVVPYKNRAGR